MKLLCFLAYSASLFLSSLYAIPVQAQDTTSVTYRIQPEDSVLRVFVGRAGLFARMGHNHVIHTRDLNGNITLTDDRVNSSARFSFPVTSLVVDALEERERAGDGYESQPSDSAVEGTRANMLGEDLLDAQQFPRVSVNIETLGIREEDWLFLVQLTFKGRQFTFEIPAAVTESEDGLGVNAGFNLDHDDIGLSPFTAVAGTLRVAEALRFELSLTAIPE